MPMLPDIVSSPNPLVMGSSVRRDEDDSLATYPYDSNRLQQQQQQHKQLDDAGYQALSRVKDATMDSALSYVALRSTCGSSISTEAPSPLPTKRQAEPSVDEVLTQRRPQAVEHSEYHQDSGVYELTSILNR